VNCINKFINVLYNNICRAKTLLLLLVWLFVSSFITGINKDRHKPHRNIRPKTHIANTTTNVVVCGSSTTLTADAGLSNYKWNTGATTQSITVNSSGSYWWEYTDLTNNQVVNGDFSSGNTGFTSSYTAPTSPPTGNCCGLLSDEGNYAIDTNPHNTHTSFASFGDHTTGTGNMMIINGASTANVTVWTENITVTPNTTYVFSVWFASVTSSNPGQLNFSINGAPLGTTITLSSTTGVWQNFTTTWSSGSSTNATIGLINQNTAANGNDFAMDDVVFAPIYHHDIIVTLNPYPVLSVINPSPVCTVYNLTAAITGYDSSTYNYFFTDPNGNSISLANAQTISQSGTYTITEQNKSTGCTSTPQTVTVTINSTPGKPTVSSS
jgi:hypothetical protein